MVITILWTCEEGAGTTLNLWEEAALVGLTEDFPGLEGLEEILPIRPFCKWMDKRDAHEFMPTSNDKGKRTSETSSLRSFYERATVFEVSFTRDFTTFTLLAFTKLNPATLVLGK